MKTRKNVLFIADSGHTDNEAEEMEVLTQLPDLEKTNEPGNTDPTTHQDADNEEPLMPLTD